MTTGAPSPPAADVEEVQEDAASREGREIVRRNIGQSGEPVVVIDADGKPRDRFGRIIPHKIGWTTWFRAIPGLASQFREIPGTFWEAGPDVDGAIVAEVSCPCGTHLKVSLEDDRPCEGCHRLYLFTGSRVLVGYLSEGPPPGNT